LVILSEKEQKKEQKLIWVPKAQLDWAQNYYEENREELKKIGVNSFQDLIWRVAELGKPELQDLLNLLKNRKKK